MGKTIRKHDAIVAEIMVASNMPDSDAKHRILVQLKTEKDLDAAIVIMESLGLCSRCSRFNNENENVNCSLRMNISGGKLPLECRKQFDKIYKIVQKQVVKKGGENIE